MGCRPRNDERNNTFKRRDYKIERVKVKVMRREKENESNLSYCISMGSKTSKSCATENMKQIKELDTNEQQEQIHYYLVL